MANLLFERLKEAIKSVMPITLIVIIISILVGIVNPLISISFLIGSIFVLFGMCLFNIGVDISMNKIGEIIGINLTKSKKIWLILLASLIIGIIVTVAEPDLNLLATQVPSIPSKLIIYSVGIGTGLFLVISVLRNIFQIKLSYIVALSYLLIFVISYFVPNDFLPLAFDAGGVTTGPVSVPFIISLGVGFCLMRSDRKAKNDSFGLIGLCSIGPIIAVLILGLIYKTDFNYNPINIASANNILDVLLTYVKVIPKYLLEVLFSILPIFIFFLIYKIIFLKLKKKVMYKILKGFLYTYLGITIFLIGVNIGFLPMGYLLGSSLALDNIKYLLIPIGMIIGYFIVAAEPAINILNNKIEDITNGNIKKRVMSISLAIGVSLAVGLSMLRVIWQIPVEYFLFSGYLLAIIMMFIVPPVFTSIAFDSGGVSSGAMTVSFLLPFAIGATEKLGGNILTDAFGLIAIVAMMPVITVQFIGLVYKIKSKKQELLYKDPIYNEQLIDYV